MVSEADRKTIRGIVFPPNALALMVQTELKLDPHSGVTVVFRSKRGDRLKILVWDGTGMVLIYKVLEQGSFAWVKTGPEGIDPSSGRIEAMNARSAGVQDGTMRLSRGQFEALFEDEEDQETVRGTVSPTNGPASRHGATGAAADCGRMTHRADFSVVLLGVLSRIG